MKPTALTPEKLIAHLAHPGRKVRMVLDTDTYNEVDDQFALAYALRSPERLQVEAVYAAPFFNERSSGPGDGMEKSYAEILKILSFMKIPSGGFVFKGSAGYLADGNTPRESEAARDLVRRAMAAPNDDPLYVVAIGAITNIASAILMEPAIVGKIVVVWLGGHAFSWPDTQEFNLRQDVPASRLIFDCGVPLIHIPCNGVTTHLTTTVPELNAYLHGKSGLGTYLTDIVKECTAGLSAASRVIWDVAAVAWLVDPEWVPSALVHSPVLTDQVTYSSDPRRHFIRSAYFVKRDAIFADLFRKLGSAE
jgi:inosine-uridine nucleoside N-ribohydrolase